MEKEFGMGSPALKEIFYEVLEYFYEKFSGVLFGFRDSFVQERASIYAECIKQAGAPLDICIGFLDGTNLCIARPKGRAQRATYNGHKRRNSLKFQALSLPDGLIFHFYSPEEGRRHDITLFRNYNIEADLARALVVSNLQFCIYADSAYVLHPYLQVGFQGAAMTASQKEFNRRMSLLRVAAEWGFKDINKIFTHMDAPRKLNISRTPAAKLYYVCAIFWNMRACIYGSESSTYFKCSPPSLMDYVEGYAENH